MSGTFEASFTDYGSRWNKERDYILFGVTEKCRIFLKTFRAGIKVKYIIDSDPKKHGTRFDGIEIKSPSELIKENPSQKIIITNQYSVSRKQIMQQLESAGFVHDRDFTESEKIMTAWKWKYDRLICLPYTELMVTGKCTLRCKQCGLYIPYYREPAHRTIESLEKDLEAYFKAIDYVSEFHLLGGEPLLHRDLVPLLEYIDGSFRERIGTLTIVTNATVRPEERLLRICREKKIEFHISNYSAAVPVGEKVAVFIAALDRERVRYTNCVSSKWSKIGSPFVRQNLSRGELEGRFNDCRMPCRALFNGKLFYCGPLASAVMGGLFEAHENDYIDLETVAALDPLERAMRILAFESGVVGSGYITFCVQCNGFGSRNTTTTVAGEQLLPGKME